METAQMFMSWQMDKENVVCLFVAVIDQSLSCIWFFVTPRIAAHRAPLIHCLPEFAQIHGLSINEYSAQFSRSVVLFNHKIIQPYWYMLQDG